MRYSGRGVLVITPTIHHCGKCMNPFLGAPHCSCRCHKSPATTTTIPTITARTARNTHISDDRTAA